MLPLILALLNSLLILHKQDALFFMFPSDICTWLLSKFTWFYFCDINVPYGCGKWTDLGQSLPFYTVNVGYMLKETV